MTDLQVRKGRINHYCHQACMKSELFKNQDF